MRSTNFLCLCLLSLTGLGLQQANAQVAVDVSGSGVKIKNGAAVGASLGVIGPDVQIEGVTVINGAVFIDGEPVPKGKTSFTGKKSGKSYQIEWGKDGNVSVSEK